MILIDNRNILRLKNRELLQKLSKYDNEPASDTVFTEQAKSGALTIKVLHEGKPLYLQSKYDPQREAKRFAEKFDEEDVKHVLFAGIGTGYHIQAFMEAHPDAKFSIYEPNEEVLHMYLSNFRLDAFAIRQLEKIFTGSDEDAVTHEIQQLLATSNNVLKIITLPVYEKIYGEQIQIILQKALESVKDKHSSLATNLSFQKRWTINSIKNFPTVLKTPNILHDVDKSPFEGKPAIIVAAGPSLNEEFENLRHIKENGLAYIFSVGSAINALIEHGIYPDAACTYDPSERNQFVIQKIKDQDIKDIPLVFGSSVGYETLEDYPGRMLHMITSQDTVSPQLLDTTAKIDIVLDAPSIAVVTFQLLTQLGSNPIILAGQNLGYRDDKRYASGIKYDFVENELNQDEKNKTLTVQDVYGNEIQTSDGFNRMRQQLEMHIASNPNRNVINTTKGGAEINGTLFICLEELIEKSLTDKVVNRSWVESKNSYDKDYANSQLSKNMHAIQMCENTLQKSLSELKKINDDFVKKQSKNMEKRFSAFDKEFSKLKQNSFYISFVEPMVRVQNTQLSEESQFIRYEKDLLKKAEVIVQSFNKFIQEVYVHLKFVEPYFEEMKEQIENRWKNDYE